ncbi:histidine phosphatase family protein [Paenibacillus caui]|uniref:histidine phosphatase family protein n=1 Tax=Paenibacillus caui TaxID=2873927 RepID=UPI001CA81307|nr:histidine phosphatase family protein [Paenibacillus caui]
MRIGTILLFLMLLPQMAGAAEARVQAAPVYPTLLNSLREGGYILYVRHGEATEGDDQPNLIFSNCQTQRNLSEEGRRQAAAFGEAIRRLQIPVQYPVLASPFCRTRETAALAFGEQHVKVDPFWVTIYQLSGDITAAEQERTLAALTSVLENKPPAGTNQVIVAHSFPKGIGLGEMPNMGTVVVKPGGQGRGYEVVDRISLDEFSGLPSSTLSRQQGNLLQGDNGSFYNNKQ